MTPDHNAPTVWLSQMRLCGDPARTIHHGTRYFTWLRFPKMGVSMLISMDRPEEVA